jgi:hypothetical protein
MKTKELSFAEAQKSAEGLERKGDSSSKGENLKAGEGHRGRQVHPGIFWKECAIACGQRSCETLLEQRRERERKESGWEREGDGGPRGVVADHSQLMLPQDTLFVK